MLIKILWSNICSVFPEYGSLQAELHKLLFVCKFLECRIFQEWGKVNDFDYSIAKCTHDGVFTHVLRICYCQNHIILLF